MGESEVSYTTTGLTEKNIRGTASHYDLNAKVEVLIKALGTMVIKPSYELDPNNIGKKVYTGPVQQPILLDDNREIAENKLIELIKQL